MQRLLDRGAMFYRDGSGALTLYIEPHINSWDCLGALAVVRAAGPETSDFLAGDGLRRGNHLIAGSAPVFAELASLYGT